MKQSTALFVGILALIVLGGLIYLAKSDNNGVTVPDPNGGSNGDTPNGDVVEPIRTNLIRVDQPLPNALVTSPIVVEGEARGQWYFEADFPVRLIDANGNELAMKPAQAEGEWMTTDFVPFSVSLSYQEPSTATGELILEKSNPSGLPENAAEVRIPVRFSQVAAEERAILIYMYSPEQDTDSNGNIMCSGEGMVPVARTIPRTITPIQDAINALLSSSPTSAERSRGLESEFPLEGVTLEGASLSNGVLTLAFNDPQNNTSGGSCRIGILVSQIRATAQQFGGVSEVRFQPEELFQP